MSHREQLVELFVRESEAQWRRSEARAGAMLRLPTLGATLSVDEIYAAAAPV